MCVKCVYVLLLSVCVCQVGVHVMGTCVLTEAASSLEMSGLSVNLSVNFKRPLLCCAVTDV